jgi:hypothetical protein
MVDIEHVRELCKRATPGPYHVEYPDPNDAWEAYQEEDRTNPCEHHQAVVSSQAGNWADFARFVVCVQGEPDDAGFANVRLYQEARTLLPEMADEIESLRRENAELRENKKSERASIASQLRDISRRVGPAANPDWVRGQLDALANRLEFLARLAGVYVSPEAIADFSEADGE